MKRSRFKVEEIIYVLKQAEAGVPTKELCRRYGISEKMFYTWRNKYAGLGVSELRKLKELEEENQRLKQLVADLSLDKHMLQEVLRKKM